MDKCRHARAGGYGSGAVEGESRQQNFRTEEKYECCEPKSRERQGRPCNLGTSQCTNYTEGQARRPVPPHAKIGVIPMPKSLEELQAIAKRVRRDIIEMTGAAKSGHPGGSLSAVELIVELYFDYMKIDPANPAWPDRDRFILSKGHAAPVLYSVMAERGYTPKDTLNTLRKLGSIYQGHPDIRFIPSLEASTGSLGEGVSLALGMGLAARLN